MKWFVCRWYFGEYKDDPANLRSIKMLWNLNIIGGMEVESALFGGVS